jgi:hypothetical protein
VRAVALGGIATESFSPMGEAIFREIIPAPPVSAGPLARISHGLSSGSGTTH